MNRRTFLATTLGASFGSRGREALESAGDHDGPAALFRDVVRGESQILQTPNLDRLAAEGVRFENAITPCPVCVPARTSILTGKSMQGTGVSGNSAATDITLDCGPSFDNLLAAQGYATEVLREVSCTV
jgi:arylsulfatase A-like enzyme